jgi:hypothetical protein
MLYWLVTAMYPQFLITLDENDEEQDVTVRVGQAVNTVGLAGTRSGISGVSVFFVFLFSFCLFLLPLPLTFDDPGYRSIYILSPFTFTIYPLHLYCIPPSPDLCYTHYLPDLSYTPPPVLH